MLQRSVVSKLGINVFNPPISEGAPIEDRGFVMNPKYNTPVYDINGLEIPVEESPGPGLLGWAALAIVLISLCKKSKR